MYCPSCGADIVDEEKICSNCKRPLPDWMFPKSRSIDHEAQRLAQERDFEAQRIAEGKKEAEERERLFKSVFGNSRRETIRQRETIRHPDSNSEEFSPTTGCLIAGAMGLTLIIILGMIFHMSGEYFVICIVGLLIFGGIGLWKDINEAEWKKQTRHAFQSRYDTPPEYTQVSVPQLITKLSPEQEAKIPEFIEKWCQIGLSTEPAERSKAEQAILAIYEKVGKKPPQIVWCTSPLANGLTRAIVRRFFPSDGHINDEVWTMVKNCVTDTVSQTFWESIEANVYNCRDSYPGDNIASRIRFGSYERQECLWEIVEHFVHGSAGEDTWEIVRNRVEGNIAERINRIRDNILVSIVNSVQVSKSESKQDQARANGSDFAYTGEVIVTDVSSPDVTRFEREKVKARVKYSLGEHATDSLGNSVRASARNSCYGQHDGAYLALFDYFRTACGFETQTEQLRGQWEEAQSAGWYLPHEHVCWVSERPKFLHLNNRNRLHCNNGPAMEYPDGWSIYALNGVVMKSVYVMTPAERLDPVDILKESNVDIRRELLRKLGIPRMISYGKEIDRQGNYRLIDMSAIFRGSWIDYAPYLLMQSPSVDGAQHMEGVSPECRTVEQAINWRASEVAKNWDPDFLS
jgi:hypothetical protein